MKRQAFSQQLKPIEPRVIYDTSRQEQHVNVSRYVSGVCPKFRKRQMEIQLRNLLNVNDTHTLPNEKKKGSKVIFPHLFGKN